MKKLIYLAIIVLSALSYIGCSSTKTVYSSRYSTKPDTVLNGKTVFQYLDEYPNEDAVFISEKKIIEYNGTKSIGESLDKKEIHTELVYIIGNPNTERLSTFSTRIEKSQKLDSYNLRIKNPDGSESFALLKDLKVVRNGDEIEYKYAYPKITKGSLIFERFSVSEQPTLYSLYNTEEYFSRRSPVLKSELLFLYPSWWQLLIKKMNLSESAITRTELKEYNKSGILVTLKDLPPVIQEPFSPLYQSVAPGIKFKVTKSALLQGPNVLKIPANYADISDLYLRYAINENFFFNLTVSAKINEITKGSTTQTEKIKALCDWVRDNINLDRAYQYRDFSDMLLVKKGNPFTITGLTQSLLKEIDVKSEYLLIYPKQSGPYDPFYLVYSEWQVPALRIFNDTDTIYTMPYLKNASFGFIPDNYRGQPAIFVMERPELDVAEKSTINTRRPTGVKSVSDAELNNSLNKLYLTKIPETDIIQNKGTENVSININASGEIIADYQFLFSGSLAFSLRSYFNSLTPQEQKEKLFDKFTFRKDNPENLKSEINNLETLNKDLEVKISVSSKDLMTGTPEEVIITTDQLLSPYSFSEFKLTPKKRVNNLENNDPLVYEKNIELQIPDNWRLQTELTSKSSENKFGTYSFSVQKNGSKIQLKYVLKLNKFKESAESYKELDDLLNYDNSVSVPNLIFSISE